jgi:hypothetical protein
MIHAWMKPAASTSATYTQTVLVIQQAQFQSKVTLSDPSIASCGAQQILHPKSQEQTRVVPGVTRTACERLQEAMKSLVAKTTGKSNLCLPTFSHM